MSCRKWHMIQYFIRGSLQVAARKGLSRSGTLHTPPREYKPRMVHLCKRIPHTVSNEHSQPLAISGLAIVSRLLYFKQGRHQRALNLRDRLCSQGDGDVACSTAICLPGAAEASPSTESAGAHLSRAQHATLQCLCGEALGHTQLLQSRTPCSNLLPLPACI